MHNPSLKIPKLVLPLYFNDIAAAVLFITNVYYKCLLQSGTAHRQSLTLPTCGKKTKSM
jgi:hypothetical protein